MSRPGGNPDLMQHRLQTTRKEPLTEAVTLRMSKSMREALAQMANYPEFIRQAIQEKLERDGIQQ